MSFDGSLESTAVIRSKTKDSLDMNPGNISEWGDKTIGGSASVLVWNKTYIIIFSTIT